MINGWQFALFVTALFVMFVCAMSFATETAGRDEQPPIEAAVARSRDPRCPPRRRASRDLSGCNRRGVETVVGRTPVATRS